MTSELGKASPVSAPPLVRKSSSGLGPVDECHRLGFSVFSSGTLALRLDAEERKYFFSLWMTAAPMRFSPVSLPSG